jgi:hypothetical protein
MHPNSYGQRRYGEEVGGAFVRLWRQATPVA